MILEQTNKFTITADAYQWILIWHPTGPSYSVRKDGSTERLPRGKKSFYGSLRALSNAVIDKSARECRDFADVRDKLDGFMDEARKINRLETLNG